jgi:putative acetyltransferase
MEDHLVLREVKKEDNEFLAAMIRAVFKEHQAPEEGTVYSDQTTDHLAALFTTPRSILWVAVINNEIMGCCGIFPTQGLPADTTELVKFYLPASSRGKGIGKKLLEQCIQSAMDHGYKKVYLESLPHYSKAVNIYNRSGFVQLAQPLGNSGHTSCNIWMLKEL